MRRSPYLVWDIAKTEPPADTNGSAFVIRLKTLFQFPRAVRDGRVEETWCESGLLFVTAQSVFLHSIQYVSFYKRHSAAAKARTGHSSAHDTWVIAQRVDKSVQFRPGDLVQVAQGVVGCVHIVTQSSRIVVRQCVGRRFDAGLLFDNVSNSAVKRIDRERFVR